MRYESVLLNYRSRQDDASWDKRTIIKIVKPRAELNDLVDAWWKTAEAMDAMPATASQERKNWHARVFEKILEQCGWSTLEWNDAVVPKKAS